MKQYKLLLSLLVFFLAACSTSGKKQIDPPADIASQHPEWSKNATIYEVNIRQHTTEGTFNAFAKDMPRLKTMGIDVLWIMPIHPVGEKNRKGTLGSYYSITDYRSVNPEFGTKEDFRNLVNQAHALGLKVIIDWVANHTAWDHPWTVSNPEFYTKNETGDFVPPVADWSDVIDLDYSNQSMRKQMISTMEYWVKEFDIDGYRCDVAEMVPMDFWMDTRKTLDQIKPVFMLAEGEAPELHEAFDMTYSWELMHLMRKVASGEEPVQAIHDNYEKDKNKYPASAYRMNIVTNHDENSWNGTAEEFFGEAQEAWFVFSATTLGMPLVYSGQEDNNKKRLEFFEKDPVPWSGNYVFAKLYQTMFELKHDNPALWNGEFGGTLEMIETEKEGKVLAYVRAKEGHQVLTVLNLGDNPATVHIDNTYEGLSDIFTGEVTDFPKIFTLPPYAYKVYAK